MAKQVKITKPKRNYYKETKLLQERLKLEKKQQFNCAKEKLTIFTCCRSKKVPWDTCPLQLSCVITHTIINETSITFLSVVNSFVMVTTTIYIFWR